MPVAGTVQKAESKTEIEEGTRTHIVNIVHWGHGAFCTEFQFSKPTIGTVPGLPIRVAVTLALGM